MRSMRRGTRQLSMRRGEEDYAGNGEKGRAAHFAFTVCGDIHAHHLAVLKRRQKGGRETREKCNTVRQFLS
jgi:hypothetical protein